MKTKPRKSKSAKYAAGNIALIKELEDELKIPNISSCTLEISVNAGGRQKEYTIRYIDLKKR